MRNCIRLPFRRSGLQLPALDSTIKRVGCGSSIASGERATSAVARHRKDYDIVLRIWSRRNVNPSLPRGKMQHIRPLAIHCTPVERTLLVLLTKPLEQLRRLRRPLDHRLCRLARLRLGALPKDM